MFARRRRHKRKIRHILIYAHSDSVRRPNSEPS